MNRTSIENTKGMLCKGKQVACHREQKPAGPGRGKFREEWTIDQICRWEVGIEGTLHETSSYHRSFLKMDVRQCTVVPVFEDNDLV